MQAPPTPLSTRSAIDMTAEADEVLIVKVHGSIDWVPTEVFDGRVDYLRDVTGPASATAVRERDPLFGRAPISAMHPLTQGPRPNSDALASVQVVENLDAYYGDSTFLYEHPPDSRRRQRSSCMAVRWPSSGRGCPCSRRTGAG